MHDSKNTAQILIFDQDVAGVASLRPGLESAGFSVDLSTDKTAAMEAISTRPPLLVIVEWDLPRNGGLELIDAVLRANPPDGVGLIILSSLSGDNDVVTGLELGADDYIVKPCSPREVVARTRAILRTRSRRQSRGSISLGELELDAAAGSVAARHRVLPLSPVEYRLLEFLMKHPGKAFRRRHLLGEVWGAATEVDERTVDVNVQRLRRLLEESGCEAYIQTVRGFGYRFAAPNPGPTRANVGPSP
jgi:two-component system phosphate regulon response regulator PhoB